LISWMEWHLKGKTGYATYFTGAKQQEHDDAGWFAQYIYVP